MTQPINQNHLLAPLKVPFVAHTKFDPASLQPHPISFYLWPTTPYRNCSANFSIAHFNAGICIHYAVCEPFLNAKSRKLNGDVHKDNCVEFFVNFNNDCYYNFEFNCLGSVKGAYGNNRTEREQLPIKILKLIEDQVSVSISNLHKDRFIQWEVTITIPIEAFYQHELKSLSGQTCYCNFTKCGDDLPMPHYLSWVYIQGDGPDFHQPVFFNKVVFE